MSCSHAPHVFYLGWGDNVHANKLSGGLYADVVSGIWSGFPDVNVEGFLVPGSQEWPHRSTTSKHVERNVLKSASWAELRFYSPNLSQLAETAENLLDGLHSPRCFARGTPYLVEESLSRV